MTMLELRLRAVIHGLHRETSHLVCGPVVTRCAQGERRTTASTRGACEGCALAPVRALNRTKGADTGHRNLRPFCLPAKVCGIRHTRPRGSATFQVSFTIGTQKPEK